MTDERYDPESHYDRVTEAWGSLLGDELHYGVFERGDESLAEATNALTQRMIDGAELEPGLEVLDVGCGTGAPACQLARDHQVEVTGITTSAVGIEAARARAAAAGLADRTRFAQRDGMDNGFPDASFDRAWVLESSHLMPDRARLVAECARVLRPGGRMVLCDIVLRRPMPFEEVRRLRQPLAVLRDAFGSARMELLDQYADHAAAAGLEVVAQHDLTTLTRPTFDRWQANAAAHRDDVVRSIGEGALERFVESCDVLRSFWDDGTLGYGLIVGLKP